MRSSLRMSGFTMVELMVTLLIAAILLGLAVPGFMAFIRSNRAEVQAQSIVNTLNYARSESVRRGQPVIVTSLAGASWESGWRIWMDRNGNGLYEAGVDDELQVVPAFSGGTTLAAGAVTQVAFDRLGNAVGLDEGISTSFAYRVDADHCKQERDITINHLGRISVARRICP